MISFRKTLRFKLFASYFAVVVAAILTTLFAHLWSAHRETNGVLLRDAEIIATDLRSELIAALKNGQSQDLADLTAAHQLSTRHDAMFVSPDTSKSSPFRLTSDELESLKIGRVLRGQAKGRMALSTNSLAPGVRESAQPIPGLGLRRFTKEPGPFVAMPIFVDHTYLGAIVVTHDRPDLLGALLNAVESIFEALLLALVLASGLAFVLAKNLTRPIARMEQIAAEFARGNLTVRSELERPDELGALARAFDGMAAEIESHIETRTRLLSDVSHELGTPVSTIQATVEAILDGVVEPEETESYLQSLLSQLQHLSHIVNDVTELARFESGQILMAKTSFEASLPLKRATDAARALAYQKGVSIEHLELEGVSEVVGDLQRLTQVLQILLLNAVHHNPPGTRIVASLLNTERGVRYLVRDDGPPISEIDQQRLFERFYKASESRTRGDSGSGLGLAIAKQILDGHGANLILQSSASGKTFSFQLDRVEAAS